MPETHYTQTRKSDHIRINLEEDVRSALKTGLERYRFTNRALPELDLADVDLSLTLFGKKLQAPLLISSMTGGAQDAKMVNQRLAEAAQVMGIAMGVGSQRAAIEDPSVAETFQARKYAPDILLFSNLGAVQLNYGYGVDECRRAVEMIEADALILHFNAVQEAIQPEGDTRFSGLLKKIETICAALPVPVIAKEVGWGLSETDARALVNAGVKALDVAGAGGTSWSQVEMYRVQDPHLARVAAAFRNWGIPTAEALQMVKRAAPETILFASGGLRDGVDIAKCVALGATLGGMAGPILKAAVLSGDDTLSMIRSICREIQICMFATGAANLEALRNTPLVCDGDVS